MMSPPRGRLGRPHLLLLTPLLLVVAAAAAAAAAATTAPAQAAPPTAPAHSNKGGGGSKASCASTYEGCQRCSATTCTKCRPNSTFDAVASKCACDAPDYGAFDKKNWFIYVEEYLCKNKGPKCKRPKYSTVAGRCVRCASFANAVVVDGACAYPSVGGYLDTSLTIVNAIPESNANHWKLMVKIAACGTKNTCNSIGDFKTWRPLLRGESVAARGYDAWSMADVGSAVAFCTKDTFSHPGEYCPNSPGVWIWGGNPRTDYPFVKVEDEGDFEDYDKPFLSEGETRLVELDDGHKFEVTREPDACGAKQLVVRVIA